MCTQIYHAPQYGCSTGHDFDIIPQSNQNLTVSVPQGNAIQATNRERKLTERRTEKKREWYLYLVNRLLAWQHFQHSIYLQRVKYDVSRGLNLTS